jgi:hypothetical protein
MDDLLYVLVTLVGFGLLAGLVGALGTLDTADPSRTDR